VRLMAIGLSLLLAACVPTPDSYPVPPQHDPVGGAERLADGSYVQATDPDAESYFIKDVRPLEGTFRWTLVEPQFRFFLKYTKDLKFKLEFGVHPVTLQDVGPLRMTIWINDHPFAEIRETVPGQKTFEKPVPAIWLSPNADAMVRIRIHNPWPTRDKAYLGFVLIAAGFVE
jgi:hypothetical protein